MSTETSATLDQPVSGPPARRNPVEVALERFEQWWERHASRTEGDEALLELLEWQLAVVQETERLIGNERAVTLRRLKRAAGSIRNLSERMSRPYSTLRGQMVLSEDQSQAK